MRRTKKAIENIGVVNFNEMEFMEDCIQVFIPVESVSDALLSEIKKAIEIDKINYLSDWEEWCNKNGKIANKKWSEKGTVIQFMSLEVLMEDQQITYKLYAAYEDKANELMESTATIEIDLSGHEREIKKLILKGMIDKFF